MAESGTNGDVVERDRPTTQRAYTMRLYGATKDDHSWRDALWKTHLAVNAGTQAFGEWLLTLRGGIDHALAEPPASGKNPDATRKNRRTLLALSWLSVEDYRGAPARHHVGDKGITNTSLLTSTLEEILSKRGVPKGEIKSWVADCTGCFSARIRDDAVWVNRSDAFDEACRAIGPSLTREEIWDILEPFFGSKEAYLAPVVLKDDDEDGAPAEEKAKDLVQKAGQWLSSRFGTGKGADFGSMARVYDAMAEWAATPRSFPSGGHAIGELASALAPFKPKSHNADGILGLISGPGYKSATRNIIKAWSESSRRVTEADLAKLAETAGGDAVKCRGNVGGKGRRPWSDEILKRVEEACGFTYLQQDGPARHSEFAVMLDHAARRVSIAHSWIKRAEAQRVKFEEDARRLGDVPPEVVEWLDKFVHDRSGSSGAIGDGYRIRRRALGGWEDVLKRWSRIDKLNEKERAELLEGLDRGGSEEERLRIALARLAQAEDESDKFGDIQLFESLADEGATVVWLRNGKPDPEPLRNYVLANDALFKQRRFKVPAYRHPDPLRHPVFCDFGNSRWEVEYAVHKAEAGALDAKKKSLDRLLQNKQKATQRGAPWTEEDERKLQEAQAEHDWLCDSRALRMKLWSGKGMQPVSLRWASKRLAKDLGLHNREANGDPKAASRADRLGRAAAGASKDDRILARGLFEQNDWNARLQAPRRELSALAKRLGEKPATRANLSVLFETDAKAKALRDRINWLTTFSAKLECDGPWFKYARAFPENAPAKPFVSRSGEYAVRHEGNDKRKGHAKLVLSRLPDLRILSVDLGHRYAAACAVWETLSTPAFLTEIAGRTIVSGGAAEDALYCHTHHVDDRRKEKTTIYRRIGPDTLADGTPHPAPWARLDRQFMIKLQGEERPARAATAAELDFVKRLDEDLGHQRGGDRPLPDRVDELMTEAVRTVRLGLKRHGRVAKIAYALNPKCPGIPGVAGTCDKAAVEARGEAFVKFLTDALADWHALAADQEWDGAVALALWNEHVPKLPGGFRIEPKAAVSTAAAQSDPSARQAPTRAQRKRAEEELRGRLRPIAAHLAAAGPSATQKMFKEWEDRWKAADGKPAAVPQVAPGAKGPPRTVVVSPATGWHRRLRELNDWITGRRFPGELSDAWRRHVGGLSLTRIATMRSLYQLHKAFDMRATPAKAQGAPDRGESTQGAAQSILDAMERMREQRVKQLASRIVEAALGVGRHKPAKRGRRDRPRQTSRVDEPCHAIVIENLRNYRPEEMQTRRENRALMAWSAGKVRKHLEEGCQLHGIHLREVQPNYTSRQCSRTGRPGVRCEEIPVKEDGKPDLDARVEKARGKGDAKSIYLVKLDEWLRGLSEADRPKTVIVPYHGGELFLPAPSRNELEEMTAESSLGMIHADINAAANIGLRALLDPDFEGRWWYVACDATTGTPAKDKCDGALWPGLKEVRLDPSKSDEAKSKAKSKGRDKVNAWRTPGEHGKWRNHAAYWNDVSSRVAHALAKKYGLDMQNELATPAEGC